MFNYDSISKEQLPSDPRFGSGPSLVPMDSFKKLFETGASLIGTSHRKPAVKNLVKEFQDNLRNYFSVPQNYEVLIGNGGATALWDMIGLGVVEKKSQHFVCGEFSSKWAKAHENIPWIETSVVSVDYGQGNEIKFDSACDTACYTLNETSTGVLQKDYPQRGDYPGLILCDATSSAGQVNFDLTQTDLFYFSPQKVLAGEGGFFIAFASPAFMERALKLNEDKERYIPVFFNWKQIIDNSKKNQTYNTPSVSNIFLINEQIKSMQSLGFSTVVEMANKKAQHVYSWAEEKEYLSPYVGEEKFRSTCVATIDVSDSIPVDEVLPELRKRGYIYDIEAYRKLGRNQLRISLFHNIKIEDLQKLTSLLSQIFESY